METVRNDSVIKLALDTIDLEIVRWGLDEAVSKDPVDRQQYYQLARDLLDGQGDRRTRLDRLGHGRCVGIPR